VKRERSSTNKIKAGLNSLSKQAIQLNEIRRDILVARLKLIDYTISLAILVYKQAFIILIKEYSTQLKGLKDNEFNTLPLILEQPIRQDTTFSTLETTKGKYLYILLLGLYRDQFI
jgi:hypothetical protein